MTYNRSSTLHLTIEKLVYGGDGLARLPADEHGRGKAAFLPFVLPGEEVDAELTEEKPGFVRGRAEQVLKSSTHRGEPGCPYFQRCGGCHYQHASYEHQLAIKAEILRENLRRIAKLELATELQVHASPPWEYRNRTRLKIRSVPEFAAGYYRFGSHDLLPVEKCPISSPLLNRVLAELWHAGRAGQVPAEIEEAEFFANSDETQFLVELYCRSELPRARAVEIAKRIQLLLSASGVTVFRMAGPGAEPTRLGSSGADEITYNVDSKALRVTAGAFFQVNRHLISKLVALAAPGRSGRLALDLYSGCGLFTASLAAGFAQVIAVESSQTSYADLLYNAPPNVKAVRAPVEQWLAKTGRISPDFVLVDPPRSGLGEKVVRGLAGLRPPRMTYISCDPATLARDLGGLTKAGYRIEQAHLVDLFPQTYHLESVFSLAR
ncbi:MAG TPA: class I SAM-dependent RNA methyltransferase [Terriglobales bacterium]